MCTGQPCGGLSKRKQTTEQIEVDANEGLQSCKMSWKLIISTKLRMTNNDDKERSFFAIRQMVDKKSDVGVRLEATFNDLNTNRGCKTKKKTLYICFRYERASSWIKLAKNLMVLNSIKIQCSHEYHFHSLCMPRIWDGYLKPWKAHTSVKLPGCYMIAINWDAIFEKEEYLGY